LGFRNQQQVSVQIVFVELQILVYLQKLEVASCQQLLSFSQNVATRPLADHISKQVITVGSFFFLNLVLKPLEHEVEAHFVIGALLLYFYVFASDVPLGFFWQFKLLIDCRFEKRVVVVLGLVQ